MARGANQKLKLMLILLTDSNKAHIKRIFMTVPEIV